MERVINCFIDRFEDEIAVLISGGQQILVPVRLLPDGVGEGDIISVSFTIETAATHDVSKEISDLQKRLAHVDPESEVGPG